MCVYACVMCGGVCQFVHVGACQGISGYILERRGRVCENLSAFM